MQPGQVKHGPLKPVIASPSVYVEPGYTERDYKVYYIEEFPIEELGYGSNRPLWREELQHEYHWRSALYEDMRARGQINPCIVWNHKNVGFPGPEVWENYVKVGRNKCWAARQLAWRSVKALVATSDTNGIEGVRVKPQTALLYWKDGQLKFLRRGLISQGCTDPAKLEVPVVEGHGE